MIEACGICGHKEEAAKVFQDIKKDVEPSIDTINAYFNACGKSVQINRVVSKINTTEEDKKDKDVEYIKWKVMERLNKSVVKLSSKCKNPDCDRYFTEEEIISSWSRSFYTYFIKCPACGRNFIPTLDIRSSAEKEKSHYFLFPPLLRKEVNNLIINKTPNVFYTVLC